MKRTRTIKARRRPTAYWIIEVDEKWNGGAKTTCSDCRNSFANGAFHEPWEFDYCPHCGRKMVSYVRR